MPDIVVKNSHLLRDYVQINVDHVDIGPMDMVLRPQKANFRRRKLSRRGLHGYHITGEFLSADFR